MAERLVSEGLAAAPDEVSRAWLLVARGSSARLWRGSEPFGQGKLPDPVPIEERIADAERALAVGEAGGLADLVTAARYALGVLYGMAGRYGEVLALSRRKLGELERAGSRIEQADVMRMASVHIITISAGFKEGLELARRAHALSEGTNPHQLMHATLALITALYHLGRWRELWPIVEQHVAAFEQEPAVWSQFCRDGPVIGATVLAQTGDLERARALAAMVGDPMAELDSASAWQGWFAIVSGDPDTARRISEDKALHRRLYGPQHALVLLEALVALEDWRAVDQLLPAARASVTGNALLALFCDRAEGLGHARGGRLPQARRALRRALAGFDRLGVPFEAARTREHLAALEPAGTARPLLQAALSTYERLGAVPRQQALRVALTRRDPR